MGIIFKKYRKDSYCEKCETTFYKQCDAFSELEDRPLKCPNCGAVLFYIDGYYYMADYYMLRGTNLKISATSPFAKIFIKIPAFILMGIPLLLIFMWVMDVFTYAATDALRNALLIPMWLRLYDTDWPAIFPLLLILYFLFRIFGYLYNNKKIKQWKKDAAELEKALEGDVFNSNKNSEVPK